MKKIKRAIISVSDKSNLKLILSTLKKFDVQIPYINFRRNIITEGVRLNELVGKEFSVGEVKLKGHDLCSACKHLQETLEQKNLIKELLRKAGLRCEILTSGKISVGDKIIS